MPARFFAYLLTVLLPLAALAAPEDDFQIKNFDLTEGRVAFTYSVTKDSKDIYVLDFKDLSTKPLVQTKGADEGPYWAPDGKRLVFASDLTGDEEIFSVSYDGSDLTQLTTSPGVDENPAYSPDGKQIVFQSNRAGGTNVYIMNADGTGVTPVTTNQRKNTSPRWSPRGDEILYSSNVEWPGWDIVLYSTKTKETKTLTSGLGSYLRPAWRPDGGGYAFTYGATEDLDIWQADKGSSTPVALVRREGKDVDPCFSDDGQLLFFAGELTPGNNDFQLFVVNNRLARKAQGAEPAERVIQVLSTRGAIRHPAWTPYPSVTSLAEELKARQANPATRPFPTPALNVPGRQPG